MSWLPVFRFVCWNILNKMLEQFCSILLTEFKVLSHLPSACKLTVVIIASLTSAGTRDMSNTFSFHLKVIFIFSTHLKLHMTMSCRCESHTKTDRHTHTHKARYQLLECPEEFTYLFWHIECNAGEISLVITTPILVHRILTSLISVGILKKKKKIMLKFAEHSWNNMHWNNNTHKNCWKWRLLAVCETSMANGLWIQLQWDKG